MKDFSKKSLCLALSLVMALSMLWLPPAPARAEDATSGQTEPLTIGDDLNAGDDVLASGMVISVGEEDDSGAGADTPSGERHGDGDALESGTPTEGNVSSAYVGAELEGADDELSAQLLGATISVSPTSITMKEGESKTVTITCKNVYTLCYISYSNSNTSAFQCTWGSWSGSKITLRVKALRAGSGKITLTLKNPSGGTLDTSSLSVTIQSKKKPTISLSPSSITVKAGAQQKVTVTVNNSSVSGYCSYSIRNTAICDANWGNWSGWSVPLTVTGKSPGSTTILIEFKSGSTTLASATLTVKVPSSGASISASPNPASVKVGKSISIRVNTSGDVYSGDYLQWQCASSSPFDVSWSTGWNHKTCNLLVTGKRDGQGTITVYWKTSSGTTRTKVDIPVKVTGTPPNVLTSPSTLTLKEGESFDVTCVGYNADSFYFQYDNQASGVMNCAWTGSWFNGNSHKLKITAKSAGSGRIQISMIKDSSPVATAYINVTVEPKPQNSPSYSFENYSQPSIPLSICERMFKSYWKALLVCWQDIGKGGVCFGMAATSGLLVNSGSPTPSLFGRTNVNADLNKADYSSNLKMTVKDFVEAMHITQVASIMRRSTGLSAMVSAVEKGGIEKPVMLILNSRHAVLAYRCQKNGNNATLTIYDSNAPLQERSLTVNLSNNSWSYSKYGGSSADISYITYDVYKKVWDSRGSLSGDGSQSLEGIGDAYKLEEDESDKLLLMSTDSLNFTVRKMSDTGGAGDIVARYVDGILQDGHDENVRDVSICSDDGAEVAVMLYVPVDYYFIENDADGDVSMTMRLAGVGSMVEVTTAERKFEIAVSDEDGTAHALLTPKEGEDYSMSVGSYQGEEQLTDPMQTTIEGEGHGKVICLGVDPSDGLYLNSQEGAEDGLSLDNLSDAAESDNVPQDFALTASLLDSDFPITASASRGGTISPDGQTLVPPGGNQHYRIVPQEGFVLRALYVNGIRAAYAGDESAPQNAPKYECLNGGYEYNFQNVRDIQTIHAEFAKDLNQCEIHITKNGENPVISVTDEDGFEPREGVDYTWSQMDTADGEAELFSVSALDGGGYFGAVLKDLDNGTPVGSDGANKIQNAVHDKTSNKVTVTLNHDDAVTVIALAYENADDGAMLPYFDYKDVPKGDANPIQFDLSDAGLPQDFKMKLIMVNNLEKLRVLDVYTVSTSP